MNLQILALGIAVLGVSIGEGILVANVQNLQHVSQKCLVNYKP